MSRLTRCSRLLAVVVCLIPICTVCRGDIPDETVRVAGIVLKWVRADKDANFKRAEPLIRKAARSGAKIVCTTECFLDGYAIADKSIPLETYRDLGEPIPEGRYYRRLARLADELDIHLIAGMVEADGEFRYNTAVLIGPTGKLIGKYRKQKLGHEVDRNRPGPESTVFETRYGKIGIMICADRTEPHIVLNYCVQGADFLVCPSGGMFGPVRNDPIVAARSRENNIPIVFVHPSEFLVTAPGGSIITAEMIGEDMVIEPTGLEGDGDIYEVCYVDLPLAKHRQWINLVDNGDFDNWPSYLGTGVTATSAGVDDSLPDDWYGGPGQGATATYDVVAFPSGQSEVPGKPVRHLRITWHAPSADDDVGEEHHQPDFRFTFLENYSMPDARRLAGKTLAFSFYARVAEGEADIVPILWQNYDSETPGVAGVKGAGYELFESSGHQGSVAVAEGAPCKTAPCRLTDQWQRFERLITLPEVDEADVAPDSYTGLGFDLIERIAPTIDLADVQLHVVLDHELDPTDDQ